MDVYRVLIVGTFVTSLLTLLVMLVAVLPHVKQGFIVVRDAALWMAFVILAGVAIWTGLQRLADRWDQRAGGAQSIPISVLDPGNADPYYVPRSDGVVSR